MLTQELIQLQNPYTTVPILFMQDIPFSNIPDFFFSFSELDLVRFKASEFFNKEVTQLNYSTFPRKGYITCFIG